MRNRWANKKQLQMDALPSHIKKPPEEFPKRFKYMRGSHSNVLLEFSSAVCYYWVHILTLLLSCMLLSLLESSGMLPKMTVPLRFCNE